MATTQPTRFTKSINPTFGPLSPDGQADLDELRCYMRSAPSRRVILITSLWSLATAIFATIAILIAIGHA